MRRFNLFRIVVGFVVLFVFAMVIFLVRKPHARIIPTAPVISVACRLKPDSRVYVLDSQNVYGMDGFRLRGSGGQDVRFFMNPQGFHSGMGGFEIIDKSSRITMTKFDVTRYSRLAFLVLDCKIANQGKAPASIGRFHAAYMFEHSNDSWLAIFDFLPVVGVYSRDNPMVELPQLLGPGTEQRFLVQIAWPIHDETLADIQGQCPTVLSSHLPLNAVLSCLDQHKLSLSDNPGWLGKRSVQLLVEGPRKGELAASVFFALDGRDPI